LKSAIAAPPSLVGRTQTCGVSLLGRGPGAGDGGGGGELMHGTVFDLECMRSFTTLSAAPQVKMPRQPFVVVMVFARASHVNVRFNVQCACERPRMSAHGNAGVIVGLSSCPVCSSDVGCSEGGGDHRNIFKGLRIVEHLE
jgi:hypothetical protein